MRTMTYMMRVKRRRVVSNISRYVEGMDTHWEVVEGEVHKCMWVEI